MGFKTSLVDGSRSLEAECHAFLRRNIYKKKILSNIQ